MSSRLWRRFLPVLALFLSLLLTWTSAATVEQTYPSISLRLSQPLTREQGTAVLEAAQQPELSYILTGWREETGTLETGFSSCNATVLLYHGQPQAIAQLTFLQGGGPGSLQSEAGLVSSALAQTLWGSTDVVGQSFRWNGTLFTVCGVFRDKASLVYCPVSSLEGVVCLELFGDTGDCPPETVGDFLVRTGLTDCNGIIYGPQMVRLLELLSWLPLLVCGLWCVRRFWNQICTCPPLVRRTLLWCLILLAAVVLPIGLSELPGWLMPPQWSDFSHWASLWESAGARLEEWLRVAPLTKDVTAKEALLGWFCGWSGSWFWWSECRFCFGTAPQSTTGGSPHGKHEKTALD